MFKLIAFLAVLAVAFAAPAPAPGLISSPVVYQPYNALPVATSGAIVQASPLAYSYGGYPLASPYAYPHQYFI
ncbi:uncharacterized protein LOC117169348 [Belonocnema kinseyi]|uniref:uncharacterized protein LOC117169348 n=1 Tax=Belonocnema kinseyi TaxID=2817044 RepID=UPI00143D017B|nr:uncharacterized protein LOC117169348 [Belonocnema kinseyi]